jgi:hypothetical protein
MQAEISQLPRSHTKPVTPSSSSQYWRFPFQTRSRVNWSGMTLSLFLMSHMGSMRQFEAHVLAEGFLISIVCAQRRSPALKLTHECACFVLFWGCLCVSVDRSCVGWSRCFFSHWSACWGLDLCLVVELMLGLLGTDWIMACSMVWQTCTLGFLCQVLNPTCWTCRAELNLARVFQTDEKDRQ